MLFDVKCLRGARPSRPESRLQLNYGEFSHLQARISLFALTLSARPTANLCKTLTLLTRMRVGEIGRHRGEFLSSTLPIRSILRDEGVARRWPLRACSGAIASCRA